MSDTKPENKEYSESGANQKLAEFRLNVYRSLKAIVFSLVLIYAYSWVTNHTEFGKRIRFTNEFLISVASGIGIAFWQYSYSLQQKKIEEANAIQEGNRHLIQLTNEKLVNSLGILERRIDSALIQIKQQEVDFAECLISVNQLEAEQEAQEDAIAANRHEALEKDFEVYKELAQVQYSLAYIQGILHLPIKKESSENSKDS